VSTHPNALLIAELSPNDLPRKTYKALKVELGKDPEDDDLDVDIPTGVDSPNRWELVDSYHTFLAQDGYEEDKQITAAPGSIVLWDPVTYGYGERIEWDKLAAQKDRLDDWCKGICEKLQCTHKIYISANYW
jgi:hypothetical protein